MVKKKICLVNDAQGNHLGYMAQCPGCDSVHVYDKRWTFNGNYDKPTFKPSYLAKRTMGPEKTPFVCHSFVTDGQIKFLNDCTHEFKGQTVELPDEFEDDGSV